MVSFYGWNRVDRFMAARKMRDSALLVTRSSPKTTHRRPHMWLSPRMRLHPGKGRPRLPQNPLPDVLGWKYSGNRHHPTEKPVTSLQPLIESFTHGTQLCWTRLQAAAQPASPPSSPDAGISVSSCLSSITVPGSNALPPCNGPCSRGPRMMTGLCRRLRK